MINFRYHVVSLTAVFLALAIGLVVGTAALNGPVADSLRDQVSVLGQQNQVLRDRVNHLNQDVEQREEFAAQLAPVVLANKLLGNRVLVVAVPSGQAYVEDVVAMLELAGASVTGPVEIKEAFFDPVNNDQLLDLAHTSLPAGITGNLPANSDGVESSSALLAAVLMAHTQAVAAEDQVRVLAAYRKDGYLGVGEGVVGPAEAVVVLSGPPATDRGSARRNTAVVTLVDQFAKAGKVVVAASVDAGDGNVVAEVRGDPRLSATVSTVDNVSTPQGRLVTAWAVADQIAGKVGHYGIGAGAELLPRTTQ